MTLAALIASGRATCSVEEAGEILSIGRCTAYEATLEGGALADCTCRVGRRKVVAVPRLLTLLGVPMPDGWRPGVGISSPDEDSEPAHVRPLHTLSSSAQEAHR